MWDVLCWWQASCDFIGRNGGSFHAFLLREKSLLLSKMFGVKEQWEVQIMYFLINSKISALGFTLIGDSQEQCCVAYASDYRSSPPWALGECAICIASEIHISISVRFLLCSKSLWRENVLLSNIKIINIVCLDHISVCSVISKCCYFSMVPCNKLKWNLNIYLIGSQFRNGFSPIFITPQYIPYWKVLFIPIRQM